MASASARIASTGRSARPTTNQARTPTSAMSAGRPTSRNPLSVPIERSTSASEEAATIVRWAPFTVTELDCTA